MNENFQRDVRELGPKLAIVKAQFNFLIIEAGKRCDVGLKDTSRLLRIIANEMDQFGAVREAELIAARAANAEPKEAE